MIDDFDREFDKPLTVAEFREMQKLSPSERLDVAAKLLNFSKLRRGPPINQYGQPALKGQLR